MLILITTPMPNDSNKTRNFFMIFCKLTSEMSNRFYAIPQTTKLANIDSQHLA